MGEKKSYFLSDKKNQGGMYNIFDRCLKQLHMHIYTFNNEYVRNAQLRLCVSKAIAVVP